MLSSAPDRDGIIARLRAAGCVFAEEEADALLVSAADPGALHRMIEQRIAGVPLEHVVGWVDFCGLRIAVAPGVFVPRQRTELMVEQAVARIRPGATVVDLACGCGAVGLALAIRVGDVRLYAADVEPAAVSCAAANLARVGGHASCGDLYDALPPSLRGEVDVLVANVPYVPTAAIALMPPEARLYEPMVALDGGPDGLHLLRRVADGAPGWLAPGGHVLVETGTAQVPAALAALTTAGLDATVVADEERGGCVVIGRR